MEVQLEDATQAQARAASEAWTQRTHELIDRLGWRARVASSSCGTGPVELSPAGARRAEPMYTLELTAAGPIDQLLALTELLEAAWVLAEHDVLGGGSADVDAALAHVRAVAAAEAAPAFAAAHEAAVARGLITTFDDDTLTIGAGHRARQWPRHAVPPVAELPWDAVGNIPIALVTGSNGKTTVTRWLARMLRAAGHVVGMSSTDGVFVDDEALDSGDYSGPMGARLALRDARVTAAALETARGGILRRGLAVHHADAACVTNLSMDHFGEYGIGSLEALGAAKLTVAHAVRDGGTLVVSADDPVLRTLAPRAAPRLAWVTVRGDDALVTAHTRQGGDAALRLDDVLLLHHARRWHELAEVREVPATLDGAATHNVINALFAAALAAALGTPIDAIQRGLREFGTRPTDNVGRLMRFDVGGVTVVVDYAHNPAAIDALLTGTASLPAERRGLTLATGGNREDAALRALARTAVAAARGQVHRFVAKDMPRYLRGRAVGEMPAIIADELARCGVPTTAIGIALDDLAAARDLLGWARAGDLLLLTVHGERDAVLALLETLRTTGWRAGDPLPAP